VGTADLAAAESKSLSVTFDTATATASDYVAVTTAEVDGVIVGSDIKSFRRASALYWDA
jgi:hypothetical protein